ncbi:MAG: hypothetical protein LBR50_02350 [Tannerella sp.]|jgi:hypothetical protein|nr:hypothetical protein [Tannerella sp.]
MKNAASIFILSVVVLCSCNTQPRQVLSLNGEWQIAKTLNSNPPQEYLSTAQVPGLVDLASPALDTVGTLYSDSSNYWYKRTFELPTTDFDIARLKIFKAKYRTKVYVNGNFVGEDVYCFTPQYYDIKEYLKPVGETNEIVICTGSRAELPDSVPDGSDYEKTKYIPGIYDNVELILSGKPFIRNIQCAPDIETETLRVVAEVEKDAPGNLKTHYLVKELKSGRTVAKGVIPEESIYFNGYAVVDFQIDMKGATLWSPENPFLYEITLNTGADHKTERFGMRSFSFDKDKKVALLNGKPYMLRGTNICIYRFFEDPERGSLPWNDEWVVKLHERFKEMHWDIARYCIGFPPERWYEICDSLGFMIQDEYPLWGIRKINAVGLRTAYKRWITDHLNHPSIVIWDLQNETVTGMTQDQSHWVRNIDLTNRPFDNGWSPPDLPTDPIESHPYLFSRYMSGSEPAEGYLKDFFSVVRRPDNGPSDHGDKLPYANPIIINEYGWLWLNRDGSTTTLTDNVYETLWNSSSLTPDERLEIYARHLAILTEYWRAHRRAAGVLHFCGLGYSRSAAPRGQTSDHWIDIENLTYEPHFYKYVKPAFAPVGLMIDVWEKSYVADSRLTVPVYITNDLATPFNGKITLNLMLSDNVVATWDKDVEVEGYGSQIVNFEANMPAEAGKFHLKAEYTTQDGETVFSMRDINVIPVLP